MWHLLLKPWIWAVGGTASAYYLAKKQKGTKSKLKEAKLELIEQQRTIDRLRAELGRERAQREELYKSEVEHGQVEEETSKNSLDN